MNNATTDKQIDDLIAAVAMAEDAAQDAEDREQLGKASKIRGQIRTMKAELAALRGA